MTNIFKNAAVIRIATAAVVASGLLTAGAAQAMDRGVYVYNDDDDAIYSVHISNVDAERWGPDLLGEYMIAPGDEVLVAPRNPNGYCRFDIMITYETGEEVILWDVNICGGRQIVADEWDARVYAV